MTADPMEPVAPGGARQVFGTRSVVALAPAHGMRAGGAGGAVLAGVLDLRPSLLEVALGLVTAAFGAQAPVASDAAGGFLGAAFDCFGLVRDLLGDTHNRTTLRESFCGCARIGG